MKFSTSTLLFAIFGTAKAAAQGQGQGQDRALANLAEQWSIADPVFANTGLAFTFDYPVSNFIDVNQAYYEVYDSAGCKETGSAVTSGLITSTLVDVAAGSVITDDAFSISGKTAQVPISIDTGAITTAAIYTETGTAGSLGASIVFCVRFGLKTTDDPPVEVNFLESVVTLTVDLSDGFAVADVSVIPKDQLISTASKAYTVAGYMCGIGTDTAVGTSTALSQGSLITVCVKPTQEGIDDGIKMRTIDSFDWIRGGTTQAAIVTGAAASNSLTTYDGTACTGGDYCQFSSILFAAFYATEGVVLGSGVSSMQFGTRRRALREGQQPRALQEAAATSEFDMTVPIRAANDGPTRVVVAAGATTTTAFVGVLALITAVTML